MLHNSNHRDAHSVPGRAEVVNPARQLRALHDREALWKLAAALWWALVLLGVSAALSLVTGVVLTRLMPDPLAYLLGTVIHLAIGLAIHLWVVGAAQRDRQDKAAGALFFALGLGALLYVFFARAFVLVEEGRTPAFAWTVSAFLLLIEIVIPALLGYMPAKAWLARNKAAEEARFYSRHAQLIETSTQPAQRWNDAEARLEKEIDELSDALMRAKPEKQVEIHDAIALRKRRLDTLREWNPSREFERAQSPAPSSASAPPLVGRDGQGDAYSPPTFIPLPRPQPGRQDEPTFYG